MKRCVCFSSGGGTCGGVVSICTVISVFDIGDIVSQCVGCIYYARLSSCSSRATIFS